jgi:hypothetical protein
MSYDQDRNVRGENTRCEQIKSLICSVFWVVLENRSKPSLHPSSFTTSASLQYGGECFLWHFDFADSPHSPLALLLLLEQLPLSRHISASGAVILHAKKEETEADTITFRRHVLSQSANTAQLRRERKSRR